MPPNFTITNAITRDPAIEYLQDHGSVGIEQFEAACPGITRRSLQRSMKRLGDVGILQTHGEAKATRYSLTAKHLYRIATQLRYESRHE